jgi:DNA-directed RNA polymerase specialized sigma24 family protein
MANDPGRPAQIQRDRLSELHDAVVTGDALALNDLCKYLLDVLQRRLCRTFPGASADLRVTAAADAILEYARRPWRFDRARGVPLDGFLHRAATRNVINLLQSERRRRAREQDYAIEYYRTAVSGGNPDDDVALRCRELLTIVDEPDRRALTAWLVNDVSIDGLAAALSVSHLPRVERQRALKRFKDRIIKRRIRHALHSRSLENS